MSNHHPSVISLFTGAGGLDLGFEAAGFETRVAVEMDPEAVETLRANREWEVVAADIHSETASPRRLLKRAKLKEGEPAILIGGPPCQPFSKSGYWARGDALRLADPRARTLDAYLRVLEETKPVVFLLENVPGLSFDSKSEGLSFLRRSIDAINRRTKCHYSFSSTIIRATEYGIPQERQRVIIVGHREGYDFRFPAPTHRSPSWTDTDRLSLFQSEDLEPAFTAWDAIGDLEDDDDPELAPTGKWADLLPSIPEGMNYLHHTDRGNGAPLFGWRRHYWSFLLKLAKALPSWTIAAQPGPAIGPFHWRSRRLSAQELCRLQTFPAGYKVIGTLRSAQRQIGNAVPSALAERIALQIRATFFGNPEAEGRALTLLPQRRHPVPPSEPVKSVPSKFKSYLGRHEAHPGTGKGYGALIRLGTNTRT